MHYSIPILNSTCFKEKSTLLSTFSSRKDTITLNRVPSFYKKGRPRSRMILVRAENERTRLSDLVLSAPEWLENFLDKKKFRRPAWNLICGLTGFYTGNVINLTFGTLAVNDVVAAAVVVGLSEYVSKIFYTNYHKGNLTTSLIFMQCFKLGFGLAFIADAFKLGY
mmetsp:Transcript_32977/g.45763  ORF Transcript_32977/g.45763 Transcript_32977/m.45763 type:complete len:166 (+) Transcript_32977:264-761(+)